MKENKVKTKFEFHRVGQRLYDGTVITGWYAYITNQEQLDAYLNYNAVELVQVWQDIKDAPNYKLGHCRTTKANVHQQLLVSEMARRAGGLAVLDATEKEELIMSCVDSLQYMEDISTRSMMEILCEDGEVYVNKNGGCRRTALNTDKLNEEIFEVYKSKEFIFPVLSIDDVKVSQWQQGNHFYLQVNGHNVSVGDEDKWNTVEAVEEAKRKYIAKHRYK